MILLLKNLLFTLVMPGTVAVYVPLWITRGRSASSGMALAIGATALAAGTAIYAWCLWDFASFGRGTPAPIDAPRKLVVRGLYRYTRNPMYVGVLTAILGWAAVFASGDLVIYALCVGAGFQLFIVLYEEPHLRRLFGKEYADYSAQVGRWLLRPRRQGPGRDDPGAAT